MKLEEIHWPVFLLKNEPPITVDGISMYGFVDYDAEGDRYVSKYIIIDDKSIQGDTLGIRRLKLKLQNVPLYRINKAIYSVGDLIRLASTRPWIIDSKGTIFKYEKKVTAPLTCHKIQKILRSDKGMYILQLEGVPERFKILNDVKNCQYAGVLTINNKRILYGLYEKEFKKTRRKV